MGFSTMNCLKTHCQVHSSSSSATCRVLYCSLPAAAAGNPGLLCGLILSENGQAGSGSRHLYSLAFAELGPAVVSTVVKWGFGQAALPRLIYLCW